MNHRKQNPRESANIFSLITYAYITDLVKYGYKKDVEEKDLYKVVNNCESKYCGDRLEKEWSKECRKRKDPSLLRTLCNVFGLKYLIWGGTQLACELLKSFLEPNALRNLVAYFQPGQTKLTKYDAYYNVAIILLADFVQKIFFYNYDLFLYIIGIETRTAICTLLFRKILKITPTTMSKSNLGNIVTLITKDVQQIRRSMFIFNDLWVFGCVSAFSCYLLYSSIGATCLIAVGIYVCVIPLEGFIGKLLNKFRRETSEKTDERLLVTQEVLSATKTIKLHGWEDFFFEKINSSRKKEIAKVTVVFYLRIILTLLALVVSKVGVYLLIMSYIWIEQPLDTSIVFFITAHFENISLCLGYMLPDAFGIVGELFAALTRIKAVLTADELPPKIETDDLGPNPFVKLENITVLIGENEVLSDVTFTADSGLTVVTGNVGCGKTVLLKTILDEFPNRKGQIVRNGSISYASQDPWCFPSTIKENILFGEAFNGKRYQMVLKVCALEYDLSLFQKGDETILTDGGQNLSKGQQARINLARAVYKESDVYLIDDCLSSLDTHVHRFVFNECIRKFLNDKIRILVTQSSSCLLGADHVYVVDKGRIIYTQNPEESIRGEIKELSESITKTNECLSGDNIDFDSSETETLLETERFAHKNIYEEQLAKGAVTKSIYAKYVSYGGGIALLIIVLALMASKQAADSYSVKLLSIWSDEKQNVLTIKANMTLDNENSSNLNTAESQAHSTFRIYTIVMALSVFLEILKTYTFLDFCRRASIKIHKLMIQNVLHAVMSFFDNHFIGNILNRFSQDVVNIDENLPFQLLACLGTIIHVGGALALVVSVNPYFFLYVLTSFGVMIAMLKLYLPIARNLQRLEASTRSPMIGHLNAALEGITTIRAFNAEGMIVEEYEKHQNIFTSAHYTLLNFQYAFGFFMSMLGSLMTVMVVCSFILFDTGTSAGSIGLGLTQIIALGRLMQTSVKSWADLENLMTATERALEYTSIQSETKQGDVPKDWSCKGDVAFENVSLTYNHPQIVLNNLSFRIEAKQKVGIVGRTGSGKSSILAALFRLYGVTGRISINGIDIETLPLNYLRKHLAVIPQDPVLFSGTIRSNLDPFDVNKDDDIWSSLEKVNLKNSISNLDCLIDGNAANFSSGQKQMICVARAILSRSKIVILDEATANMDRESENLIQDAIKRNFADCTVITIAHRLRTILDCDLVLVLDHGEVKEFDDPRALLMKRDGFFHKMIRQEDK